jgi:hypothetical protein
MSDAQVDEHPPDPTEAERLAKRLEDEASYPARPRLVCDLVMKGGITSGVTYPWAVCEVATTYKLRNIGGTSAGAIAAAAAAAAEVGRGTGGAGFARLATLPRRLSAKTPGEPGTVMFNLFQPSDSTRPLFRILEAGLGGKGHRLRQVGKIFVAGIAAAPISALVGAALGILAFALLLVLAGSHGVGGPVGMVAVALGLITSALVALVGAVAGIAVRLATAGLRSIGPAHGFGICRGYMPAAGPKGPKPVDDNSETRDGRVRPKPLTTWLADELDLLAGKDPKGGPLTLADLRDAGVNLKMFTTNLTEGTPYTLPFRTHDFSFDPDELERYFPERVVRHMKDHPPTLSETDAAALELARQTNSRLLPLPDPAELPVVVAMRLSLSFPVLLSAVPLWRLYVDDVGDPVTKQCWFSDGGITSNFPIHFFDSPLPRWPTFGINLGPTGPGGLSEDESKNVWSPLRNRQGGVARWSDIHHVLGFGAAILDTMQNWMDNAQTRVPGYRDRVVLVKHTKDEGGMNLDMPKDRITALATRGLYAGRFLVRRFSGGAERNPGDQLSWDTHRWVRFRSFMPLVEDMNASLVKAYRWRSPVGTESYAELIDDAPADYAWAGDQRGRVSKLTGDAMELAAAWTNPDVPPAAPIDPADLPSPDLSVLPLREETEFDGDHHPFALGLPDPRPAMRIVRDF